MFTFFFTNAESKTNRFVQVRRSEFVSWWLPLEMESDGLVMDELVRSEERNTWTGSKEDLDL